MGRLSLASSCLLLSTLSWLGCGDDDPPPCPQAAPQLLRQCVAQYGDALAGCYATSGEACAPGDPATEAALASLRTGLEASCVGEAVVGLELEAATGRLENACASEASSAAWRSYGGPQGAVWSAANEERQSCLDAAHLAARDLIDASLLAVNDCLATPASCDPAALLAERATIEAEALTAIEEACPQPLSQIIAVTPEVFVARAAHQVDCLAATSHASVAPLTLGCGPENADFDAPRGEWMRIPVDGEKWGTRCGDGSAYSFWIRLAPEGARLDRVLVGLQGGGVCVFGEDCGARMASAPGLFTAADDEPTSVGVASDDPSVSAFADWTKVYLPYCTQDVFAGGGVLEDFGEVQVERYGSVNLRAAIQMVRDVLWAKLDAEGGAGFRPDEIVALFGGWSAGAYGTLYNYHWLLDDLQWPRTIAFPDAGMALDNGSPLGVSGLGNLKIPAWGMRGNLPPYCFAGECAVGPVLYEAISPRLLQVPEQQMLLVSNPRDQIQQNDAFFEDEAVWINTVRQSYCDTRDLPGIHYYFTSVATESVHVVSIRPELWSGSVDGEVMADWFERAVTDPMSIDDRVEEGDFVAEIPGVEPYPCSVAP